MSALSIPETSNKLTFTAIKKLSFGKGELLEGHAWSSDDQVFAVAGCKIYLFLVSDDEMKMMVIMTMIWKAELKWNCKSLKHKQD